MALVLTSCTNRKRLPVPRALKACSIKPGSLERVVAEWAERVAGSERTARASEMYCGRAFRQAESAAESLGARLAVVSAGLGLVDVSTKVPAYSLTVVPGTPDNILDRIGGKPSAADWWQALSTCTAFPLKIGDLVKGTRGAVLVALPAQYITMIASDLLAIPEKARRRLRVFSLSPRETLPEGIVPYLMPYDARFDGPGSPLPDTRGDFAQRVLSHFASTVLAQSPDGDFEKHASAVRRLMSTRRAPVPVSRDKASDDEIIALIHRYWKTVEGRSGRMLRYLRDDLGVACEQSRFRDLFNAARESRS